MVAIDGVDAAGKTTLAHELAAAVEARGRPVVQIGFDAFHRSAAIRHRRGRESGEGYYRDTFDLERFAEFVLTPALSKPPRVRPACHDLERDQAIKPAWQPLAGNTVVLVEGVFLHRPELRDAWHFSVFLQTRFEVTVPRGVLRDGGDAGRVRARYERRYVAGQRLYLAECQLERIADWVVDHDDPQDVHIRSRAEREELA